MTASPAIQRVVVQAQNVLAFGGAQADVQRFCQAEVLGEPAEADGGKFFVERSGAVRRAVIDDDDLMVRRPAF